MSVGGTRRSVWYGSAAAAAAARLPADVLVTAGSAQNIASDAMPRPSASRRVHWSSGGSKLATDRHLPDERRRAVRHRVDRPQLVRVTALRQRPFDRPCARLDLRARHPDVVAV